MCTTVTPTIVIARKALNTVVTDFDYNKRSLNENEVKELKRILRNNADVISPFFEEIMKGLRRSDSEYRFALVLVIDEIFQKSHVFRVEVTSALEDIMKYTAETDPLHYPLPPPKDAAIALKAEALKRFKSWHEKYAVAYPKLDNAMQFLRSSKAFDFERVDVQLEVERRRVLEADQLQERKSKIVGEQVKSGMDLHKADIERCVNETRRAIELLVPRFDLGDTADAEQLLRNSEQNLHAYSNADLVVVTVPLKGPDVKVTEENDVIISSLHDCMKLLQYYEKLVTKWLKKLTKFGSRSMESLSKEIIDLKGQITLEIYRCRELKLPFTSNDTGSDSDELEDVPEKEGLELDFKKPDEVPQYILDKLKEKGEVIAAEKLAGRVQDPAQIASTSKVLQHPKDNGIPVLSFGLDLKYWGKDDIEPAEVPRNNADCHRFWRPPDESCMTSHDSTEAYRTRVFTYIGEETQSKLQCRAPLRDGNLCPRMDRERCPLHGIIIERDQYGFPVKPIDETQQKKRKSTKADAEEEEYLRDVEASTNVDLRLKNNKRKKTRGRAKRERPEGELVRERLSTKLFNRSTLNRVCNSLDSIRKARAARNFEHQFNYALSRNLFKF